MDYRLVLRKLAVRDQAFFDLVGPDKAETVLVSQLDAGPGGAGAAGGAGGP